MTDIRPIEFATPAQAAAFGPAVRAGDFLFVSGVLPVSPETGRVPARDDADARYVSTSKLHATQIVQNLSQVLAVAGAGLDSVLNAHAYFPAFDKFTDFDEVWRAHLPVPPPRSSVGIVALPVAGAHMQVDVTAYVPRAELRREAITSSTPQPLANYTEAFRLGEWVFVAGQVASDFVTGVPAAARRHAAFPHFGSDIKLQTRFVLANLRKTLEATGSSMAHVAKATVFLNDLADFHAFEEVWTEQFEAPPARTVINTTTLAPKDTIVEIELIAYTAARGVRHRVITSDNPPSLQHHAEAVVLDGLLFASAHLPTDYATGVPEVARKHPNFPYYASDIKRQTSYLLGKLTRTLQAGGSGLDRIVKAQVFLTDVADLPGFDEVWRSAFEVPPPRTVVVTGGLLVPDARVEIDVVAAAG